MDCDIDEYYGGQPRYRSNTHVSVYMTNKNTTGATGGVKIEGLPFTALAGVTTTGTMAVYRGGTNAVGAWSLIVANTSYIRAYVNRDSSSWTYMTHDAGVTRYFNMAIAYKV